MITLEEILKSANSYLDLEYALPTGTELSTRINFANQALREGASAYKFKEFSETYYALATTSTVDLPENFRELEAKPVVEGSETPKSFEEIKPEERHDKVEGEDYCYLTGSVGNYKLNFGGLEVNSTVTIQYQRFPSAMATYSDICELPDADYVKLKLISYVLQSRSDERFPTVDADANLKLQNMIGRSMVFSPAGKLQIPSNQTYRLGRR